VNKQKSAWVKFSDELPTDDIEVIIAVDEFGGNHILYKGKSWSGGGTWVKTLNLLIWQPLPELPKFVQRLLK
jgi:hypothetical protein